MTRDRTTPVREVEGLNSETGWPTEINFADGLVGCEDWRHFELVKDDEAGPVMLLQCLDESEVGFFVVEPSEIVEDYQIDIPPEAAEAIGLSDWQEARVLCTLIIRPDPPLVIANLLGPLVINPGNGRGVQVILNNSQYSARHVVVGESKGEQSC